jgi:hypothetical protein
MTRGRSRRAELQAPAGQLAGSRLSHVTASHPDAHRLHSGNRAGTLWRLRIVEARRDLLSRPYGHVRHVGIRPCGPCGRSYSVRRCRSARRQ